MKRTGSRTFTFSHRQRLERAAALYLEDAYRRKTAVRASEFAAMLGVRPDYLSRIVPEITGGLSLQTFLRLQQVAYATQQLRRLSVPVDEIAIRCGFGTVATFYRWFRKVHGTTPGAFREVKK